MEDLTKTNTALGFTLDEFNAIMSAAPTALTNNRERVSKAMSTAMQVKELALKGMNDDVDQIINDVLVKMKLTVTAMKEVRTPSTKILDQVIKEFTGLEFQISPENKNGIYQELQTIRNNYHAEKARKKEEDDRREMVRLEKEKETVRIASDIQRNIRTNFDTLVNGVIANMNKQFDRVQLENYDNGFDWFKDHHTDYSEGHLIQMKVALPAMRYHNATDDAEVLNTLVETAKTEMFPVLASEYSKTINAEKIRFLDLLPSRRKTLEEKAENDRLAKIAADAKNEQAIADAEKCKKELAAQELERQQAEQLRQENEAKLREKEAENNIVANESAAVANVEITALAVEAVPETTAQVRQGYEINVLKPAGWMVIVAKWFELKGATTPAEKFPTMKLESMKTACEKHAHKTGEKIVNSMIEYVQTFKVSAAKD